MKAIPPQTILFDFNYRDFYMITENLNHKERIDKISVPLFVNGMYGYMTKERRKTQFPYCRQLYELIECWL